jgi:tetratricopeptide (TPR) repeat protein
MGWPGAGDAVLPCAGVLAEALAVCRQGRLRCPRDADLLLLEGQLLQHVGEPAAAEACFLQLLASRQDTDQGALDLGIYGYKTRHQLAQLYRSQNRIDEAREQWRAAVDERPDYVPAWLGLADLYQAQDRVVELEAHVRQLESVNQTRVAGMVLRARLLIVRGALAAARQVLEQAQAVAPHSFWPRALLGQLRTMEGRGVR